MKKIIAVVGEPAGYRHGNKVCVGYQVIKVSPTGMVITISRGPDNKLVFTNGKQGVGYYSSELILGEELQHCIKLRKQQLKEKQAFDLLKAVEPDCKQGATKQELLDACLKMQQQLKEAHDIINSMDF